MDHISIDAASARHPDLIRRSLRDIDLHRAETRGVTRHQSPRHEIPAPAGGYLSVSPLTLRRRGTPAAPAYSEQRRETW